MRKSALLLAPWALAVASGCVSLKRSPEAQYFVLRSVAEPSAAPETGEELVLGLLPAHLPGSLERPQLVSTPARGELHVDPLHRWAEPLDEGVTRALAENLGALLPRYRVVRSPWPAATPLRARLLLDVHAFGLLADGTVHLEGSYALLEPKQERSLARRTFSLSRPAAAAGDLAAVEAMSQLLGELSRAIASAAEGLPPAAATSGS